MAFDAQDTLNPTGTVDRDPKDKQTQQRHEEALVTKLGVRLKSGRSSMGDYFKQVKKFRKYVSGKQHDDGGQGLVRANLIQSFIKRSTNRIYARNPEFSIRPTESVAPSNYRKWRLFGKTAEIVLNRHMDDVGLKRVAKAVVRASKTVKIGWMKLYYQTLTEANPIYAKNFQDSEEKLRRLRYLEAKVKEDGGPSQHEAEIAELELLQNAIENEKDIIVSEGLVADHIPSENIILDLSAINSLDQFCRAPFIAEEVWTTVEDVQEEFGKKPVGATLFQAKNMTLSKQEANGNHGLVKLIYYWDRKNMQVYTLIEGMKGFIKDPTSPAVTSEQWYPYYPLGLNQIDGDFWPLSDAELLMDLQDEHNTARTNFREHREKSIPHWVASTGAWGDKNDVKSFLNADSMEITLINTKPGENVLSGIAVVPTPPIDPSVYDTRHINDDMNRVVDGGEGPAQPATNSSKTLGEAEILSAETAQQSGSETDEIEDWFRMIAKGALELLLQVLSPEQVYELAGDPAGQDEQGEFKEGSIWPDMSMDNIYDLVSVEIRAGSSGRPNKQYELQSVTQFMPQFLELIKNIAELEAAQQPELAKALRKFAQEMLRRFDERIDVEEFFPSALEGEEENQQPQEDPAQAQQEQMAQAEQAKTEFEKQKFDAQMDFDKTKHDDELLFKRQVERAKLRDKTLLEEGEGESGAFKFEEDMDKLAEAITQMTQALVEGQSQNTLQMQEMAEGMKQVLQNIGAPKRVIRDEQGKAVGVETVLTQGENG